MRFESIDPKDILFRGSHGNSLGPFILSEGFYECGEYQDEKESREIQPVLTSLLKTISSFIMAQVAERFEIGNSKASFLYQCEWLLF